MKNRGKVLKIVAMFHFVMFFKMYMSRADELSFKKIFSFSLPFGKADATPSSALPKARGRQLQLRP
jgi:hypothetical protein